MPGMLDTLRHLPCGRSCCCWARVSFVVGINQTKRSDRSAAQGRQLDGMGMGMAYLLNLLSD